MEKVRLGHIVFYVSDLEKSSRFYREIVGLQESGRTFNRRAAVFTGGSTHHELMLIEVNTKKTDVSRASPGLYHTGWCIGDNLDQLRHARKRIESAGISLIGTSDHGISQSLYLYDPDGNEIELYVDNPDYDWKNRSDWLDQPVRTLDL